MRDIQAAEQAGCEFRHDTDHGPVYGSQAVTFPRGSQDMDPARFDADGWGPCAGLAIDTHDSGRVGHFRWWARCRGCGKLVEGSSEGAVERKMREHGAAS